jgi:hypothetical protein
VAGFAAAMVALVSNGFPAVLLVTGAVILVQQLEGNLLQPLIVGRSVKLHPVAVLLSLTAGGVLWGVAGAFLAVPPRDARRSGGRDPATNRRLTVHGVEFARVEDGQITEDYLCYDQAQVLTQLGLMPELAARA